MKYDSIVKEVNTIGKTLSSLMKVMVLSRGASSSSSEGNDEEIVILGNGPSLRKTIDLKSDWLLGHNLMAVNFAALTKDFLFLRPRYYILADGHFFNSVDSDPNVGLLWKNLNSVTWQMTLIIPSKFRQLVKPLLLNSSGITLRFFNLTPVEGLKPVAHKLFDFGLGMPRPRNVLIPAIMEAIRLGYKKIYICGADHSWTKTLDVDEENYVISIQPHFYEDNDEEHKRVRETYKGIKLHEVLESMTVAFRSYWEIKDYAKRRGVEIINATPGSMIDAFPKLCHSE